MHSAARPGATTGATEAKGGILAALTAAALALPGLAPSVAQAEDEDGFDFQYSRYEEGDRKIFGNAYPQGIVALPQRNHPVEVDGLRAQGRLTLRDRLRLRLNFLQDTWSGATPIGSAPVIAGGGNAPHYGNDGVTITGASPLAALPMYGELAMDRNGNFIEQSFDPDTGARLFGRVNNRHTLVMSSASPETRRQGDFTLSYDWNEASLDLGGGISSERDYRSNFLSLGGRVEFNQRLTTLNWGLSYTRSRTHARLDPDALPFIATDLYDTGYCNFDGTVYPMQPSVPTGYVDGNCVPDGFGGYARTEATLHGRRHDVGLDIGVAQVVDRNSLLTIGVSYMRSTGYMGNPYKVVFGHVANFQNDEPIGLSNLYGNTGSSALLEVRPRRRNLFDWRVGYKRFFERADGGLHLDYHFAHDDWGIHAHTLEGRWVQSVGNGWTITPRLRYYTQSRADFYATAVFQLDQINTDADGNFLSVTQLRQFPTHYSSDYRLAGYGALGGGVSLRKAFPGGLSFQLGLDYYAHKGNLKLGGGGEERFADFHSWLASAQFKIDLDPARAVSAGSHRGHSGHGGAGHDVAATPAGVLFDHVLPEAGAFMVGYRFMRGEQGGAVRSGRHRVDVQDVRVLGCEGQVCAVTPGSMSMNMHMLDLMYAPTNRLTLMLMPQWVDMKMRMLPNPDVPLSGVHGVHGMPHVHETGGFGDTGLHAIFKLFDRPGSRLTLSVGGTIPTGSVDQRLRKTMMTPVYGERVHYGMQLGSGTWDLQPSITWSGGSGPVSWGSQLTGVVRAEARNKAGFSFGDVFQASAWGGLRWTPWIGATLRGTYTSQGRIHGRYRPSTEIDPYTGQPFVPEHLGPFDFPSNYGGHSFDVGVGVGLTPGGAWTGSSLRLEWVQPVRERVNGYQQRRERTLLAQWTVMF